jgi:hypothetical protein
MAQQKYWRVLVRRGRKHHLTGYVEGQSSGDLALRGKALPEDERCSSSQSVVTPKGDECEMCLIACGYLKPKSQTPEQRQLARTLRLCIRTHGQLQRMAFGQNIHAARL